MKRSIVCLMLLLGGCYVTHPVVKAPPAPMQHVVVCWQKHPGDATEAAKLIDASYEFRNLKGVVHVFAGGQHSISPTTRPIDDTSFDVLIVMSFESPAALRDYQNSPKHQKATKELLQPLCRKVVVYDAYDPNEANLGSHRQHK